MSSQLAQGQDVAEDQLPFPPGIRGADDLLGLLAQGFDDLELLVHPAVLDQGELELLRHEGEGVQGPALEGRIIVARLLQGDQMAEGPGDRAAPPLDIPLLLGLDIENLGNVAGHGGLFGNNNFHSDDFLAVNIFFCYKGDSLTVAPRCHTRRCTLNRIIR